MGNSPAKSFDSINDVLQHVNEKILSFSALGSFAPNDFVENLDFIKTKNPEMLNTINEISVISNQMKSLNKYDPLATTLKNTILQLLTQIPNPIVDETQGYEFWLKIYNLLICDTLCRSKFRMLGKSGNVPTLNHKIQELPQGMTFNQINLMLNYEIDDCPKTITNYYQLFIDNEKDFSQTILKTFYTTDNIYVGLTYNLEVIKCFSKKVQNVILMHVILDNKPDFSGDFRYNCDNNHLKLPQNIEKSEQFLAIDEFDDALDLILFTVGIDFENLSFLKQCAYREFIDEHQEYFSQCAIQRHKKELEKKT